MSRSLHLGAFSSTHRRRRFHFALPAIVLYLSVLGAAGKVNASEPPFFDWESPRLSSVLPRESVASVEGSLATLINPAALEARREVDFTYLRTLRGEAKKDDTFLFAWGGMGIGLEYMTAPLDGARVSVRKTTLSGGSHLGGGLYWGTARSWYASDAGPYDRLATWDVGLLFRRRWVSLGLVSRRVNRPKFRGKRVERTFDFGVAFRPGTDRITVSFDLRKPDDESFRTAWDRRRVMAGLQIEPVRGLRLAGNAYSDAQFEIRALVSIDTLTVGNHQRLDHGEARGAVGIVNLHQGITRNALRRRRFALVATPDEWKSVYWRVRRDPRVRAVVVKLQGERRSLAEWQEMRAQLAELKKRGVTIAGYIGETGTGGYWLASIADTILADPIASIRLTGLHSGERYYAGALSKLDIEADFVRAGKFKSGVEPFTRRGPSAPVKANRDALMDDLYDQIVTDIAAGRGVPPDQVRRWIDAGPYLGETAVAHGIVDGVATPTEAERRFKSRFAGASLVKATEYARQRERPRTWGRNDDRFVIVRIDGIMVDGDSLYEPFTGLRFTGARTVSRAVREAGEDPQVRAIVLDVDSGGGLVTASEFIWRAVEEARKSKPVVARIGGIGASGAYYVAAGADEIVAEPASITGSIGVYTGHVSLRGMLEKAGITYHSNSRGANAGMNSVMEDLTETQRRMLRDQVDRLYALFLRRVAAGRDMTTAEVDAVAQGRVWTGRQALSNGLVDELGGLRAAIQRAKALAGLPPDSLIAVEVRPRRSLFRRLLEAGVGMIGGPSIIEPATRVARLWGRLSTPEPLAWATWTVGD